MQDWTQTLTIISIIISGVFAIIGFIMWLDSKHEKAVSKMDERWKWLFDWAHYEVNDLKERQYRKDK